MKKLNTLDPQAMAEALNRGETPTAADEVIGAYVAQARAVLAPPDGYVAGAKLKRVRAYRVPTAEEVAEMLGAETALPNITRFTGLASLYERSIDWTGTSKAEEEPGDA